MPFSYKTFIAGCSFVIIPSLALCNHYKMENTRLLRSNTDEEEITKHFLDKKMTKQQAEEWLNCGWGEFLHSGKRHIARIEPGNKAMILPKTTWDLMVEKLRGMKE